MKKIMGSKSWYRKRKRKEENESEEEASFRSKDSRVRGGAAKKRKLEWEDRGDGSQIPTRSVIFTEYSEDSKLTGRVKEILRRLEGIVGCKIKAVERYGTPIARLFPLTRLWEGFPVRGETA